ncbi:OmpA family protein [Roseomonas sp. CECT 9278]|uniref:OmpA family protein n=1 Tax=Roseomonas sp. CECT 9278 TaxID=2845823 RepID=UPI001EF9BE27|nr:OmpA family protein [Roseomonas sp. CECT 9278]CAH0160579.1 Outer membrane protein [Roseomonas sp. CECT 9278]
MVRKALLAATMLAVPALAQAQAVSGLYVGGGAGLNWLTDSDGGNLQSFIDSTDVNPNNLGLTPSGNFNASFDLGGVGVLALGYGFGNGLRLELEGNFRYNEVNEVTARGFRGNSGGIARTYGVMVNALYDFGTQSNWPVLPYVGIGAGYAWQEYDNVNLRARSSAGSTLPQFRIDDTDGRFAYQAIVGAALPIQSVPGLALTAEYRFFGTLSPEFNATAVNANGVTRRSTVEVDNFNHSVLVGVRYNFGQAPRTAPVPAAAAPAPARTFLVFFDWNRADLSTRARQIIADAAQARSSQAVTRIEVTGHTDTSGSPQYNQGLSVRRANAVAAELVRLGVPRSEITATGVGESQLLVATPDNTREPQNRRVEIVLR